MRYLKAQVPMQTSTYKIRVNAFNPVHLLNIAGYIVPKTLSTIQLFNLTTINNCNTFSSLQNFCFLFTRWHYMFLNLDFIKQTL